MKGLKILMVSDAIYPDKAGGSYKLVYGLSKALVHAGHNLTVVAGSSNPALPHSLTGLSKPVFQTDANLGHLGQEGQVEPANLVEHGAPRCMIMGCSPPEIDCPSDRIGAPLDQRLKLR